MIASSVQKTPAEVTEEDNVDASCRVTVVGTRRRVDATLPAGIPVAELLSDLAQMLGEGSDGSPAQWALVRAGGHELDPELGLEDQGVVQGTMLFLRDVTSPAPAPVVDDYAERVAIAVDAQGGRWSRPAAQWLFVAAAGTCLSVAGMLVLIAGDRGLRTWAGLLGAAVAALAGVGVSQLVGRRAFGGVIILASLPLWAAGGAGIAGQAGADSTGILAAALGAVAIGSWFAILFAGLVAGDLVIAPAIGLIVATLLPALVLGACFAAGVGLLAAAAVLGPLGLAGLALAPPLATRVADLDERDAASLGARARGGRRLLAAMLIGIAFVLTASSAVLAASGGWFAWGLVAAIAVGVVARARHFRFAAEVVPLVGAGLAAVILLEISLVPQFVGSPRAGATVAVLIGDALVLIAASAAFRSWDVSPRLRRQLGRLELLAIVATVPLALGALGIYEEVGRLAHRLV